MKKIFSKKLIKNTPNRTDTKEDNIGLSIDESALANQQISLSQTTPNIGMGSRMHARFAAIGGIELELPSRTGAPRAAAFD